MSSVVNSTTTRSVATDVNGGTTMQQPPPQASLDSEEATSTTATVTPDLAAVEGTLPPELQSIEDACEALAAELTRIHEKHAAHGRVHDAQLTKLEEAVAKLDSMYKDAEENLVKLCAVLGVRCEL